MPDEKVFYSNSVVIGRSNTDFALIFQQGGIDTVGRGVNDAASAPHKVLAALAVAMSPAQFKMLVAHATNQLAEYEREVGPIALHPDDQAKHDAFLAKKH